MSLGTVVRVQSVSFRRGFPMPKGANIEKVTKRLRMIAEKSDGILSEQPIIDDAQHPGSPLHPFFTWDEKLAAQKFWERQARDLIACVEVTLEYGDGKQHRMRQYVNIEFSSPMADMDDSGYVGPRERSYVMLDRVMSDADMRAQSIAIALEQYKRWEDQWRFLSELESIFKAGGRLVDKYTKAPKGGSKT